MKKRTEIQYIETDDGRGFSVRLSTADDGAEDIVFVMEAQGGIREIDAVAILSPEEAEYLARALSRTARRAKRRGRQCEADPIGLALKTVMP